MLRETARNRRTVAILVVLGLAAETVAAQDTAVILGAGRIGTWSTVGFVANSSSSAITLKVEPFEGPCPAACIPPSAGLNAHSSLSLQNVLASLSPDAVETFETFYLTAFPDVGSPPGLIASPPNIGARLVDQSHPGRSVDIPVILLSRLEAVNPSTLNFGGVTHGGFGQSNLVLGNIVRSGSNVGEDLTVTLDLFDAGGTLLGTVPFTVPYSGTALIGDVAGYISGVPAALGQLRVTKTSGNALMWGILYTVDASGAVTSTAGVPLSP